LGLNIPRERRVVGRVEDGCIGGVAEDPGTKIPDVPSPGTVGEAAGSGCAAGEIEVAAVGDELGAEDPGPDDAAAFPGDSGAGEVVGVPNPKADGAAGSIETDGAPGELASMPGMHPIGEHMKCGG